MTPATLCLALLSALVVAGAAQAQTAAETSNSPQRAGEASTMTKGVPNAKTSNTATTSSPSTTPRKSAKAKRRSAAMSADKGGAAATTNTPDRAGEASTMTNGQPNKKTTN